jgi:hypothetical protein
MNEETDLALAMSGLVSLCSLIDKFHSVAEHAVYEPGELCGHGLDGDRRP